MATIDNLTISILEMPEEELFNFIRDLRNNRRISLTKPPKKSTVSKSTEISTNKLLSKLSESGKETLLRLLEEKING